MLQSCWVSAGDAAWPDAGRDRIEQQIIRAYVQLIFAAEAGGSRTVTLSRQSGLEVRLTEMPRPGLPTFWLEIHALGTRSIIDSLGALNSMRMNWRPPSISSARPRSAIRHGTERGS